MVNIDTFHIIIYTLFSNNIFIFLENTTIRNDHIMDIYDGDEEMRQDENEEIREDENEESEDKNEMSEDENEISEDENEISEDENEVSEYERMTTEFNENDEDKDDREETSEEEDSEEVIVDQPFNSDQMSHSFGEFAPYFKNITESLFFCWMQKHRICKLNFFETYK